MLVGVGKTGRQFLWVVAIYYDPSMTRCAKTIGIIINGLTYSTTMGYQNRNAAGI